jgi:predicted ATPase/DNA-binding SARP family transcriptional activator
MQFRILGPLEVFHEGVALDLGGQQQRVLLVALLLEANRPIPADRLIDALWGGSPPATAPKALQVHVSHLRKLLGRERLVTRGSGYQMRVEADELDAALFERLWAEGRRRDALAQWRSAPLPELVYHPYVAGEIARLEERRLLCIEERIDEDLAEGRHDPLVAELEALVREHPLREGLRGRLMLALYRSNRQAEALQAYQDARRALTEELGIEPGRDLRELQRRILDQDPELDAAAPDTPRALPRGTVTLLFTDIEGSTRLAAALRDRYGEVIEAHRRILRAAVAAHRGVEVDTQGDAYFAAFASARDAVAAAVEAHQALADFDDRVRVRIGLHTGEPEVAEGGYYFGVDLSVGARICAAAHGGQIVVSPATRELLADDVAVRDLGDHILQDVPAPLRLFQVVTDGLLHEFPPLRARPPGNLVRPPSGVYGRADDVRAIRDLLLGHASLVTVTGPGGVGKTTTALAVAWELQEYFRDGIYAASLAAAEPNEILVVLAQVLEVEERPGETLLEAVAKRVARRAILIQLDDFESHVASAPVVAALLERCPELKVLATSRERLHLRIEREYRLGPLPDSDAAAMFVARAAVAGALDDLEAEAELVQAICRRLDGLPLAIELAAARTRALPLQAIHDRLEHRLEFLTGGARDLPVRQQTLVTTIAWSYDLLGAEAQAALRALAVFAGGVPLDGAEAVLQGGSPAVDVLLSLCDRSLLVREGLGSVPRFSMLETIREFALERAAASGDEDEMRRRHASFVLALTQRLQPELSGPTQADVLGRLGEEHDNLRVALAWCAAEDEREMLVALCAALWRFWIVRGHLTEGRTWLERALEAQGEPRPVLAEALYGACALNAAAGVFEQARRYGADRLEVVRDLGDGEGIASALLSLANVNVHLGELEAAGRLYEEAAAHARTAGALPALAAHMNNLGYLKLLAREPGAAVAACGEAAGLFRELVRPADAAGATLNVGTAQLDLGNRDQAAEAIESALEQFVALKYDEGISYCLDAVAALALADGGEGDAASLAAAAAAVRAAHGVTPEPVEQRLHEETVDALACEVPEPPELGDAIEVARAVLTRERRTASRQAPPRAARP